MPVETVQIAVARYVTNPDGETVEFALAVSDDWQRHGVGRKLMSALIDSARLKGYRAMVGDVLAHEFKDVPSGQQPGLHNSPAPG